METMKATFPIQMPNGVIVPVSAEEIREALGASNFDSAVAFCVRKKIDELGEQTTIFDELLTEEHTLNHAQRKPTTFDEQMQAQGVTL